MKKRLLALLLAISLLFGCATNKKTKDIIGTVVTTVVVIVVYIILPNVILRIPKVVNNN